MSWFEASSRLTVHPHMRGDNVHGQPIAAGRITYGPPPHAWGQRGVASLSQRPSPSVHPHMRGDNISLGENGTTIADGPPPHAWGQRPYPKLFHRLLAEAPVHPHMRGDNVGTTLGDQLEAGCVGTTPPLPTAANTGPPPHAWGQLSGSVSS